MSNKNWQEEAQLYLANNGVLPAVAKACGLELALTPNQEQIKARLRMELGGNGLLQYWSPGHILWIPHQNWDGDNLCTSHWTARFFPPPVTTENGKEKTLKFLSTKGSLAQPYILPRWWEHSDNRHIPAYIVEGPIRTVLLDQQNACGIGLCGVWGVAEKIDELVCLRGPI